MVDLFQRTGLEQDTGSIQERWGQDGSNIVNISTYEASDSTIYTVTAGKTLFVTDIIVTTATGSTGSWRLRDGNGGAEKFSAYASASESTGSRTFKTPLRFTTSIYYDESSAGAYYITITGWEE